MKIARTLILFLALLMPMTVLAKEDELAVLLEKCLFREMVAPDSIEYNLQLLEKEREGKSGARRAVYTACLAQLYAMRAYSDVTGEWRKRSVELFREALEEPEVLYNEQTKDWLPIVKKGKDEKIYGRNMLYVVWRAANEWARDSVMSEQELIDFYVSRGNAKPAEVKRELLRLQAENDSILRAAPRLRIMMAEIYYPGDSLCMDIDTANVKSMGWKLLDAQGKLVGRNVLCAPNNPGRYTVEVTCKTDARLRKKPKKLEMTFVVSRLQAYVTEMPGKQVRVSVVDAKSGKPCPDAVVVKNKEKRTVKISLGADSCLPEIRYYERYSYNAPSSKELSRVAIYTDRAIYRPGQKVMLSAILYGQKHWDARVRGGEECSVKLLDKSRKVLTDTVVRSDEFGTLSAIFQIPEEGELGWYTVMVGGTARNIKVEEYKRPVFYVEMDEKERNENIKPLAEEDSTQRDSVITVYGHALNYDGTPLRGGRVTATAQRICCWWWRGGVTDDVRRLDTVYTDMEGRFVVKVPVSRSPKYRFAPVVRVEVSVLSVQGETQRGYTAVRLFADPPMEVQASVKKDWLECPVDSFDTTTPARLEFRGKAGETRYVHLTAFAAETVVLDTMMVMTDTLHCMSVPYEKRYGDGLRVIAAYVLNGEVHTKNLLLRKRLPDTKLTLHWDTFRDYTQPGAEEQWTLRVYNAKGEPVRANVMLAMYDASLDAFVSNKWMLSLGMNHSIPYSQIRYGSGYEAHGNTYWLGFDVWLNRIRNYEYSHLDMKYFQQRGNIRPGMGYPILYAKPTGGSLNSVKLRGTGKNMADTREEVEMEEDGLSADGATASEFDDVELRSDFSETAMFMPQLRTDEEGRVNICFTVPQSLTTWALNGVAHTKDLHTGTLSERIVARKALATKLHLPRFAREKDRISFTVSISNTGNKEQKGKMQVIVLDAQSDKIVLKKTASFVLASDRDTVLSFTHVVPEGMRGLRYNAVVKGAQDSDGEQREIPVLSSVVELTESKALTLEAGANEKVNVAEMFPKGSTNRRLIVTKVADPVQIAVDALPEVARPKADDVLSYASAYYAAHKLGLPDTTLFINKVYTMQKADGSLPWFDGLAGNAYLTREVGYLLARLGSSNATAKKVMAGIKRYLLADMRESVERRKEHNKEWTPWLTDMRTLYVLTKDGLADKEILQFTKKVLKRLPDNLESMDSEYIAIAMIVKHALNEAVLEEGVEVLQTRLNHKDGTYLAYRGGSWPSIDRRLHIHTQVMEAWQTVCPDDSATLRGMQRWLLNQKRTQGWKTPIDCIDAVFALTGGKAIACANAKPVVQRDTLDAESHEVVAISNGGNGVMWAAVYAEYSMPVDKVEDSGMDIGLEREFSSLTPKVGDRISEKILLNVARDYEYIVLSVPRAGCVEPVSKMSGCGWQKGVSYYMQVRDDRTDYFIPSLPHGKYIIETEMTVERTGSYASGIPTIECCYADEFRGHGESVLVQCEE